MTIEPPLSRCPLCAGIASIPVGAQSVPALAPDAGSRDWPTLDVQYRACRDCGTVSQSPTPDPRTLDRYYATVQMVRHVPAAAAAKQIVYADRLALLRRITGLKEGTCLEVGCGNGLLLQMIADQWGLTVRGLEPSVTYDTAPVVPIVHCTLQDFDPVAIGWPARYDLVYCRHVLEHVTDPRDFLRRLAALVEPDGWLYLEVPSSALHARVGLPASGQNIHAVHLHHYTGPGLAAAMAAAGLMTVHLEDRDIGNYPSLCLAGRQGFDGAAQFRTQFTLQQARFAAAAGRLDRILRESAGAPVVVWGAGADLGQVLPLVPEPSRRQLSLYDRSPAKQGHRLHEVPILDDAGLARLAPSCIVTGCGNRSLVEDIRAEAAGRFPHVSLADLFEGDADP